MRGGKATRPAALEFSHLHELRPIQNQPFHIRSHDANDICASSDCAIEPSHKEAAGVGGVYTPPTLD